VCKKARTRARKAKMMVAHKYVQHSYTLYYHFSDNRIVVIYVLSLCHNKLHQAALFAAQYYFICRSLIIEIIDYFFFHNTFSTKRLIIYICRRLCFLKYTVVDFFIPSSVYVRETVFQDFSETFMNRSYINR
jgi:hypothetical protein